MELLETESFTAVKIVCFSFLRYIVSLRRWLVHNAVIKPAAFVLMLLEVAVPLKLR